MYYFLHSEEENKLTNKILIIHNYDEKIPHPNFSMTLTKIMLRF
jgi:hypothetical protein